MLEIIAEVVAEVMNGDRVIYFIRDTYEIPRGL